MQVAADFSEDVSAQFSEVSVKALGEEEVDFDLDCREHFLQLDSIRHIKAEIVTRRFTDKEMCAIGSWSNGISEKYR